MTLQSLINFIKPLAVSFSGAVFSGAAVAAKQYIASGGSVTDYKSLGYVAALGGLSALGALYIKPPASSQVSAETAQGLPVIPPTPPQSVSPVSQLKA